MEDNKNQKTKEVTNVNGGVFSARLEALISAALQDGVLTKKEIVTFLNERISVLQSEPISVQQPKCSEESQTTIQESQYLIVNGTVYNNFSGSKINKSLIRKVAGNVDIVSVTIPTCVKEIVEDAFKNCSSLTSVTIGNSVTSIGWSAFEGCNNLKEIDFSRCTNLEEISCYAFSDCNNIHILDFSNCVKLDLGVLDIPQGNLKKLVLPSGQKTFNRMFLWDSVDISNCKNITSVGYFKEMKMKEIVFPDSIEIIGTDDDEDEDGLFYRCKNLKTIVMPAGLKEIKGPLGGYMEELKKIDFSKVRNLRTISKKLVDWGCYKLKELVIPQGVTEIEDEAFGYIDNLKRLFLPPTLESMGDLGRNKVSVYCFSPSLEELEPLVYGWDDDDDDNDWDDDDLEGLDEEDVEELKEEKKKIKINLFVLPQYLESYIAQRKAERIPEDVLIIQEIPEEYRYYYDN